MIPPSFLQHYETISCVGCQCLSLMWFAKDKETRLKIEKDELPPPSYLESIALGRSDESYNKKTNYSIPEVIDHGGYYDYKGKFRRTKVKDISNGKTIDKKEKKNILDDWANVLHSQYQNPETEYSPEARELHRFMVEECQAWIKPDCAFNNTYICLHVSGKDRKMKFYSRANGTLFCKELQGLPTSWLYPDRQSPPMYEELER